MSDKVKPCPFCGKQPKPYGTMQDNETYWQCETAACLNYGAYTTRQWNARPIEDTLIAERDRAAQMVDWLLTIGNLLLNQDGSPSEKVMLAEDEWRKLADEWWANKGAEAKA